MKVTIITVSYNARDTIKSTIESVISQEYKNIEYIVVDKNSKDGTLDIIERYKSKIDKLIVENDNGVYDAMNKGLSYATGDIVSFLNADDIYLNNKIIGEVVDVFKSKDVDTLYGDVIYVDRYNLDWVKRYWRSGEYRRSKFLYGWQIPHPAFFAKKELYKKYGAFDLDFKISADFELILRFLYKNKATTYYLNKALVKMRTGGMSNKSLKNIITGNINCLKAFRKNGISINPLYLLFRLKEKISQFIC